MAQHQPIRKTTPTSGSDIPDKLYFRIGEVAKLCRDVEMALRIKSLLYNEGYTIPGARQVFKAELKQKEPQLALIDNANPNIDTRQLRKLQKDLRDLHALLSKPSVRAAVHPIRTLRNQSTPRRTAEKLFDLPPLPENNKR